jgi:hypothetical protein
MNLNKYFNRKEIGSLLIASLVLGLIFSFRQWGYDQFSLSIGIANWFRSFLLSFIILAIYLVANKSAAKLHGATIKFKIWNIERYWFVKNAKISNLFGKKIKAWRIGIYLPIILAILSNGIIKFAAVGYTEITEVSAQRVGKKYKHLTDFEIARIHLAGPIVCLLLAVLLSSLNSFNALVEIAKLIAVYSFLPFSKLDGAKILFGSLPLYIFGLIFIIGSLILTNILSSTATIFLALLIAIILVLIYLYRA